MQTELPIYEGIEDAIRAAVQAIGGAKDVAQQMWPDKTMENARDYLLACLDHTRREKLDYTQMVFIFRKAKEKCFHAGFDYFARDCGYEARPITPAEEVDRLTTVIEQATKALSLAVPALERIQRTHIKAAA